MNDNKENIFVSASAQQKDIASGCLAGADEYITKPFHIQQLLDTIDRHLK